jgi:hypothetical protein
MGLSICRSIIETHGGLLSASQGSPNGAVFQFTLPVKAEYMTTSHMVVTEQANAGSRQIQRGGASEHSHRAKKDRHR